MNVTGSAGDSVQQVGAKRVTALLSPNPPAIPNGGQSQCLSKYEPQDIRCLAPTECDSQFARRWLTEYAITP